jgi:hypothetical protein
MDSHGAISNDYPDEPKHFGYSYRPLESHKHGAECLANLPFPLAIAAQQVRISPYD